MRIAICINKLVSAGAERLVVDQIHEFRRRGIEVNLITLAPERDGDSFMPLVDLPIHAKHLIAFRSLLDVRSWLALIRLLRREKPDVLFTHLWFANTIGRIVGTLVGIRTISFEHNVYDGVKTRKQFLVDRFLQDWCFKIVAVSEAVRDSLVRHGIARSRIVIVENGIDLARYREAMPADIDTKDEFMYLFIGRLVRQKGVDVLLRAFANVKKGVLLIVGEGDKRVALERLARDLGLGDRVRFLGIRKDVPALLKRSDCLVLPSRFEGLGIVLIEAFASGTSVVATNVPAVRSFIADGVNAILVPVEDADTLAHAMWRIQEDPSLRQVLQRKAAESLDRFSITNEVDVLLRYV